MFGSGVHVWFFSTSTGLRCIRCGYKPNLPGRGDRCGYKPNLPGYRLVGAVSNCAVLTCTTTITLSNGLRCIRCGYKPNLPGRGDRGGYKPNLSGYRLVGAVSNCAVLTCTTTITLSNGLRCIRCGYKPNLPGRGNRCGYKPHLPGRGDRGG